MQAQKKRYKNDKNSYRSSEASSSGYTSRPVKKYFCRHKNILYKNDKNNYRLVVASPPSDSEASVKKKIFMYAQKHML